MNKRFIAVLVFAFVVASGASLLLYRLMAGRQQTARAAASTVKIVVAARNLELGTLIKESDLKLSDWSGNMPAGATGRTQDFVGRAVLSPVFDAEPLLESRLAPKGAGGGLAATIPVGMRAVAVRVNEVVGVAGFVGPGMRVDILISGSPPAGTTNNNLGTLAKTLLQNIEVLSAGQDFKKDTEGKPVQVQVVNLLVTPEQAEMLSLASNQTTIQLVLRNPLDRTESKTNGAALANLYTGRKMKNMLEEAERSERPPLELAPRPRPVERAAAPAPPAPRPQPAPYVMEIIQGTKRAETKFTAGTEEKNQ